MAVTKRFLRQLAIKKASTYSECEIPGEPMTYSHRLQRDNKKVSMNHVRIKEYRQILRCFYPQFTKHDIPLVVIVRFYVTPFASSECGWDKVRTDKVPATRSYELCEYQLAFLEILRNALFSNYAQIVKVDAVKFYSKRPRTCFKIMTWSDYGEFQNNYTVDAKTKGFGTRGKIRFLQPKLQGSAKSDNAGEKPVKRRGGRTAARPTSGDISLPSASPGDNEGTEKKLEELHATQ